MFPICSLARRRRRGRKRWPGQDAGGTPALPDRSGSLPLEGSRRQAKAEAVGGQEPGRQAVAAATAGRIRTVLID